MYFSAGIHPCQAFPSNQDASLHWNSSLQDISIKSGCISPLEFIPPRHFHQIRMNFLAGIHPSKTFPSNQDEFPRWNSSRQAFPSNQDEFPRLNSSLQDISIKSGCISPLEFIPPRHFYQIRMNTDAKKHAVPRNHPGSLAPRKLIPQFPPISPGLSFHQKAPPFPQLPPITPSLSFCPQAPHPSLP